MKPALPRNVFEKSGTYWYVKADGEKRRWTKLCRVKDGLPAMYLELSKVTTEGVVDGMMPKIVADWLAEVGADRGEKTKANDAYVTREIADAFAEFRANQVKTTDVTEFLKQFKKKARTFNLYRAGVQELMRFAEEKGFREPGSNPVQAIKTMPTPPRTRYITDSELRRIKVSAHYGKDGKRTRSAASLCAMIDMAYLTGQSIGDLLDLEWSQLGRNGILFARGKVEKTTGAKVLIEWTPRLQALVDRIKGFKKRNIRFVFTTQEGQPYTYSGASSAWKRAVKRSGVRGVTFHDLRAKALTDVDGERGIGHAQTMGAHSTQTQTSDYVRHKKAKKTGATR
jgi:integrase